MSNSNKPENDILYNFESLQEIDFQHDDIDIDSDDLYAQVEKKDLENRRYESDTDDRKWLAKWTAWTVSIWLGMVLFILLKNCEYFHLSSEVLVTLLATTTLNVLGLSFIVLRGHFNSSNAGDKSQQ